MRKSRNATRAGWARVGLTTSVVGAALLVSPQAAWAAPSVTPPIVPAGGNVTIKEDGTPFAGGNADRVELLTTAGATCPVTYSAPTTAILAAAATVSSTTSQVVFTLPPGATANSNGQVKRYTACVYVAGVATSSARAGAAGGYPVYVGTPPAANPAAGITGGGNRLDITAGTGGAIFTGVTTIGSVFTSAAECPATYGTPTAGTAAPVVKTSDTAANLVVPSGAVSTSAAPTPYNVCLYSGTAGTSALISFVPYTIGQLALSQGTGPWQGGNSINITSPNQFLAGIDDPGVLFTSAACPSDYDDTGSGTLKVVPADNIRKLSNTRLATSVPAFYASEGAATSAFTGAGSAVIPWNLCVYNGLTDTGTPATSSDLVVSNPYRVTTIQSATGITPKAGPALGGSLITVTGSAFPTEPGAMTATLGGTPLTDINVLSSNAFTARTPRHAPANNAALVVTTAGGSSTLPNAFSYTSSLAATPNTAPNTRVLEVVVNGVGFESAPWNNNLGTGAHIFLVKGSYSSTDIGGTTRANPPVADCTNVLVLSDIELICKLDLTNRLNAAGGALLGTTAPAVNYGVTTVAGSRVLTGDGSPAFAVTDIGKSVIEAGHANIPAGTVITDFVDTTHVVMSNAATGVLTANDNVALASGNARSASVATTSGQATVTADTGTFTASDVGKYVVGPGIAASAARTVSSQTGSGATLSGTATAGDGSRVPVVIAATTTAVPEGAYNLQYVSNAAVNAVNTDPTYVQSPVSSTSTFTVSAF